MNITSEKNIFLVAVFIFFAIIIVLFYVTSGKRIEERGIIQDMSPLPSSSEMPLQAPTQNNTVKVKEDDGIHAAVRYEHGLFNPRNITITNETGCFVEIQNVSDQDVIPRLGPYIEGKEKGFLYPSIAPDKSSLIDPRYGTITQFFFYNKNNPSAVFTVFIDPTCL